MYFVLDQGDVIGGATVSPRMFGTNLLISDERFLEDADELRDAISELGVTDLRYPGGSVTEASFDISDIAGGSLNRTSASFRGTDRKLIPFDEFLDRAAVIGVSASLVIPTKHGLSESMASALLGGRYGDRMPTADYLQDVAEFVDAALALAQARGVAISGFEIGNEFWGSGRMTATEYGKLAAAVAVVVGDRLEAAGLVAQDQPDILVQTLTAAGLSSPNGDAVIYVERQTRDVFSANEIRADPDLSFSDFQAVTVPGQGSARSQNLAIIDAFEADAIDILGTNGRLEQFSIASARDEIDAVVDHYYTDQGFDVVDTGEQFGFSQQKIWRDLLDGRDPTLPMLEFHMSEWNTRRHAPLEDANNRGLQQAAMMVEMFYEMVTHDVTSAHFWPLAFNRAQSNALVTRGEGELTIPGQMFRLMQESLIGLAPVADFEVAHEIDLHGFSDANRAVFLVSERGGSAGLETLDLTALLPPSAARFFVSVTALTDGGAGGQDEKAQPVFREIGGRILEASELEGFDLFLEAWAVARIETVALPANTIDLRKATSGNDTLEGSNGPDTLSGGMGDDSISGGAGADILFGGPGDDVIRGQLGDDRILAGAGDDYAEGGWGKDTIYGDGGDDRLLGEWGDDWLYGGAGNDLLDGGPGDDTLIGGDGNDTLLGGAGDDLIIGEALHGDMDSIAGQVFRLYEAALARSPDLSGHASWTRVIAEGGLSLEEAALRFVTSAEFQSRYGDTNDETFVTLLYNNVLGRNPDASGYANWVGAMTSGGKDRPQALLSFSESAEFQKKTLAGSLEFSFAGKQAAWTDEVFRLYQATLDRLPDLGGLLNHAGALAEGKSYGTVAQTFLNSSEFSLRYGDTTNEDFVTLLYQNVLDRDPDVAGWQNWTGALEDAQMTRGDVVQSFAESREFKRNSAPELMEWMRARGRDDRLEGGGGADTLFGGALADEFVFAPEAGSGTVVVGLEPWDWLDFSAFRYDSVQSVQEHFRQVGDDVVFSDQGTDVRFVNVELNQLGVDAFLL